MNLYTAHWFAKLPANIVRVGVSRGTPRGQPAGYRMYRALAPGTWFNKVTPPEYLQRYNAILAGLDPARVFDELQALGEGKDVAMLCFESPQQILAGTHWCHRHIASTWIADSLGVEVQEYGYPGFDPWVKLRANGVTPPGYAKR